METTEKRHTNHIGKKIARIRELRGMKQETLAYDMGISQQAVSKIEQSEEVEKETLERVAKALGVSPLLFGIFHQDIKLFGVFLQDHFEPIDVATNEIEGL